MQPVEQFAWFLGRFHVLVLHLPLGILTLAAALEILIRFRRFRQVEALLPLVWAAGALSAIATAALGFMHASEESFTDMPAVDAHRWAGVALCVAACAIAVLRIWRPVAGMLRYASVAVILVLMIVTGHLGGNLTHGDTYLLQYAPAPLRVLAGLPASAAPRPQPRDVASADIFLDVVAPALAQRCSTCHNNSKRSGGLSVASYESLMKGGKNGPVIRPGDAARSDLMRRVTLAPASTDFMPKEGKTPLNDNEVAAIGWWIGQGAPRSASVASLKLTANASQALQSLISTQGAASGESATAISTEPDLPSVAKADEAAVAALVSVGFIVRNAFQGSNLLDVDYTSTRPLSIEDMQLLARLAPNLLRLNLRHAGITDAHVKALPTFPNLRQLRLERNDITDAGARDIATMPALTSLNLTNTRVTDAGVAAVARMPRLKSLFVWATPVTPGVLGRIRVEHPSLHVDTGLGAREVPAPTKKVPPDF
jgi:uncharacterized membrane protein